FGSSGLGLPLEAVDARARGLGNLGIGLSGGALLPGDPAAAARLRLPSALLVAQPSWSDASDGVETNYFQGTRFPLMAAAYPVAGGIFSIHFASLMDQDFQGERVSSVMLGGVPTVTTDSFEQDGSVSSMNVGFARMLTPQTSVGLTVGRYTGTFERSLIRTVDPGATGNPIQDFVSAGSWTYAGYLVTGGVATRVADLLNLAASATWSTQLDAEASATTQGGDGSFDVPLQLRAGASADLAPGLTLSASAVRADWSAVADDLNDGSNARATTALGVGLELTQARLLGREAPLRLGFRRADLPFSLNSGKASERIFSAGLGLSLNQTGEFVLASADMSLERGRRSAGVFAENFWRATLSLRLAGL
ncbi:MAG: hypothetical protein OEN00_10140, partial [Gemmatimonadota bacterium]|nr:hypothetical protein [Gemmatimonadota bacterium]